MVDRGFKESFPDPRNARFRTSPPHLPRPLDASRAAAVVRWAALVGVLLGGCLMHGGSKATQPREWLPIDAAHWRLVSDRVMGGLSSGGIRRTDRAGVPVTCLQGIVRTENNGGFLQLALELDDELVKQAKAFDGLALDVAGNGESYNVHLRTADLWRPWQSYRASFTADPQWRRIEFPFAGFEPYRTDSALRVDRLQRIGIVAIGRAFAADICVAAPAFYRVAD
jgi:hypothetical protein